MNYDKSHVTYRLMFVGDPELDFEPVLVAEGLHGADAAAKAGLEYMETQWVGERTPELYGEIWMDSVALLTAFATNDAHGVVVRVAYGSLVVL